MSGTEILVVLLIVGGLFLLSVRMSHRRSTALLVLTVAILLLALISLSKLTMTLLGATLFLGIIVVLIVLIYLRNTWSHLSNRSIPQFSR